MPELETPRLFQEPIPEVSKLRLTNKINQKEIKGNSEQKKNPMIAFVYGNGFGFTNSFAAWDFVVCTGR